MASGSASSGGVQIDDQHAGDAAVAQHGLEQRRARAGGADQRSGERGVAAGVGDEVALARRERAAAGLGARLDGHRGDLDAGHRGRGELAPGRLEQEGDRRVGQLAGGAADGACGRPRRRPARAPRGRSAPIPRAWSRSKSLRRRRSRWLLSRSSSAASTRASISEQLLVVRAEAPGSARQRGERRRGRRRRARAERRRRSRRRASAASAGRRRRDGGRRRCTGAAPRPRPCGSRTSR